MPRWYGIDSIGFEWRGSQNDPLLRYKGRVFNGNDVQDGLWERYLEDGGNPDNEGEWGNYVIDNAVGYLEELIYAIECK